MTYFTQCEIEKMKLKRGDSGRIIAHEVRMFDLFEYIRRQVHWCGKCDCKNFVQSRLVENTIWRI
jgi:hypothetical protein